MTMPTIPTFLHRALCILGIFCSVFCCALNAAQEKKETKVAKVAKVTCQRALLGPSISQEFLDEAQSREDAIDAQTHRLRDAVQRLGFPTIAFNRDILSKHSTAYTFELPVGFANNQKHSGRCVLFAGSNMLRSKLISEGRVEAGFDFSENYLYFFSMLEKSNTHLEDTINTLLEHNNKPLKPSSLRAALNPEIHDGGWFEHFQFLVGKYGLVPQSAMGETISSEQTSVLNTELRKHLGAITSTMRVSLRKLKKLNPDLTQEGSETALRSVKMKGLTGIWRILTTHLGTPPKTFEYRDKTTPLRDGAITITPTELLTFTPKSFAKDFVRFDPHEFVVVSNFPRRQTGIVYEKEDSSLGVQETETPEFNRRFINVENARMQELVVSTLKSGTAVWIGADIHQDIDTTSGILHPQLYDRESIYNFSADERVAHMTRANKVFYNLTSSNHAMAITGFDRPDPKLPVIKFKVENSWGDGFGTHGNFHMYREWFEQNVFQIVVPRALLSKEEAALWNGPAQVIPRNESAFNP